MILHLGSLSPLYFPYVEFFLTCRCSRHASFVASQPHLSSPFLPPQPWRVRKRKMIWNPSEPRALSIARPLHIASLWCDVFREGETRYANRNLQGSDWYRMKCCVFRWHLSPMFCEYNEIQPKLSAMSMNCREIWTAKNVTCSLKQVWLTFNVYVCFGISLAYSG